MDRNNEEYEMNDTRYRDNEDDYTDRDQWDNAVNDTAETSFTNDTNDADINDPPTQQQTSTQAELEYLEKRRIINNLTNGRSEKYGRFTPKVKEIIDYRFSVERSEKSNHKWLLLDGIKVMKIDNGKFVYSKDNRNKAKIDEAKQIIENININKNTVDYQLGETFGESSQFVRDQIENSVDKSRQQLQDINLNEYPNLSPSDIREINGVINDDPNRFIKSIESLDRKTIVKSIEGKKESYIRNSLYYSGRAHSENDPKTKDFFTRLVEKSNNDKLLCDIELGNRVDKNTLDEIIDSFPALQDLSRLQKFKQWAKENMGI